MKTILCIDDDLRHGEYVRTSLSGYRVVLAENGMVGEDRWLHRSPDLVVLDLGLPDMHGLELLDRLQDRTGQGPPVLVLTGMADSGMEQAALSRGVKKVLRKPVKMQRLRATIAGMMGDKAPGTSPAIPVSRKHQGDRAVLSDTAIVGTSRCIGEIKEMAKRYASADHPVMLSGESGTGKELFARYIHHHSQRSAKPLVSVNCASIPESVAEAELFGCERGAYTGAVSRPGYFEQASGGTLFLDEIGDLPLTLQGKLLRALESGTIRRLGSTRERNLNLRIITATNRDLQEMVRQGRFREDLLYRISILDLTIPPLRERIEDVGPITLSVLQNSYTITDHALERLYESSWPGNVRQLINVLGKAMVLSGLSRHISQKTLSFFRERKVNGELQGQGRERDYRQLSLFD